LLLILWEIVVIKAPPFIVKYPLRRAPLQLLYPLKVPKTKASQKKVPVSKASLDLTRPSIPIPPQKFPVRKAPLHLIYPPKMPKTKATQEELPVTKAPPGLIPPKKSPKTKDSLGLIIHPDYSDDDDERSCDAEVRQIFQTKLPVPKAHVDLIFPPKTPPGLFRPFHSIPTTKAPVDLIRPVPQRPYLGKRRSPTAYNWKPLQEKSNAPLSRTKDPHPTSKMHMVHPKLIDRVKTIQKYPNAKDFVINWDEAIKINQVKAKTRKQFRALSAYDLLTNMCIPNVSSELKDLFTQALQAIEKRNKVASSC